MANQKQFRNYSTTLVVVLDEIYFIQSYINKEGHLLNITTLKPGIFENWKRLYRDREVKGIT